MINVIIKVCTYSTHTIDSSLHSLAASSVGCWRIHPHLSTSDNLCPMHNSDSLKKTQDNTVMSLYILP